MKKKIELCGRGICFELERKNVKNINLRVKADGSVFVSASRRISESVIDEFLRSKAKMILRAIDNAAAPIPAHTWQDGDCIYLYGLPCSIKLEQGAKFVRADISKLCITVTGESTPQGIRRALEAWLTDEAARYISRCCKEIYTMYSKYGVPFPTLRFRKMRSRWGSCRPDGAVLTFNTALVHVPPECIIYVVYHEFTHFLHPDHSKAFYSSLEQVVPEWKKRRQELKKFNFVLE